MIGSELVNLRLLVVRLRYTIVGLKILLLRGLSSLDADPCRKTVTVNYRRVCEAVDVRPYVGTRAYTRTGALSLSLDIGDELGDVPPLRRSKTVNLNVCPSAVSDVNRAVNMGDHDEYLRVNIVAIRRLVPGSVVVLREYGSLCVYPWRNRCLLALQILLKRYVGRFARNRRYPSINSSPRRN